MMMKVIEIETSARPMDSSRRWPIGWMAEAATNNTQLKGGKHNGWFKGESSRGINRAADPRDFSPPPSRLPNSPEEKRAMHGLWQEKTPAASGGFAESMSCATVIPVFMPKPSTHHMHDPG
jgi:hypothetical protein